MFLLSWHRDKHGRWYNEHSTILPLVRLRNMNALALLYRYKSLQYHFIYCHILLKQWMEPNLWVRTMPKHQTLVVSQLGVSAVLWRTAHFLSHASFTHRSKSNISHTQKFSLMQNQKTFWHTQWAEIFYELWQAWNTVCLIDLKGGNYRIMGHWHFP